MKKHMTILAKMKIGKMMKKRKKKRKKSKKQT